MSQFQAATQNKCTPALALFYKPALGRRRLKMSIYAKSGTFTMFILILNVLIYVHRPNEMNKYLKSRSKSDLTSILLLGRADSLNVLFVLTANCHTTRSMTAIKPDLG